MALPTNILQSVATYQKANLALLQNSYAFIANLNTKFKNFENIEGNLGDSVEYDLPPRFVTNPSLVATFQGSAQRKRTLTVNQAENVAYAFSAEQFIFQVEDYMETFGRSAVAELGAKIEANVALNCISNTYRTFGDGITQIDSYQQLAQALANYRNYGAPKNNIKGIIPDTVVPSIIGSGLQDFALNRNNEDANSWELGKFSQCEWFESNLLPKHIAGSWGQAQDTLTFKTIDPTGTLLELTGPAGPDVDAVKAGDVFTFDAADLRFLTFTGHQVSGQKVQVRAVANTGSDANGDATITIDPALISTVGSANQNINRALAITDTGKMLQSHRAGLIWGDSAFYLAMPRLPDEVPFPTATSTDPDTGVSLRMYHGSRFGENERGTVMDNIWGSDLVPEYALRLAFVDA